MPNIPPADVLVVMSQRGCSLSEATAWYEEAVGVLIALTVPIPTGKGTVSADTLNVRVKPSTAAPVTAAVKRGQQLEIWGRTPDNAWLLIADPTGWVSAQYVTIT